MTEWTVNNKLNDWYRKQYHIKLPKNYETKSRLYFTAAYSPFELFSTGSVGLWLDPSDLATMYQDAAGTTAVTTPGQPVGLRLDKSKGLALGAETVVNGAFDDGVTGWSSTTNSTAAVVSGEVEVTISGGSNGLQQTLTGLTAGNYYQVKGRLRRGVNATEADLRIATTAGALVANFRVTSTSNTEVSGFFVATATSHLVRLQFSASIYPATIFADNISVRELAGNHATQSVLASRPVYGIEPAGGRRNLLTFSEDFSNAAWGKSLATISANTGIAPDGTTTADSWETLGFTYPSVFATTAVASGVVHTFSVYAKAGTLSSVSLEFRGTGTSPDAVFNLSTGAVTSGVGTIQSAGNGWYRCSITKTSVDASELVIIGAGGGAIPAGNIFIWGAQLELGSTATPYQKVVTAFDVTEAGVQTCHYVQYDGSDDGMITNSIDFTATDKMSVFAGVRKISDAVSAVFLESSTSVSTNNGTFVVWAPLNSGAISYALQSRGTTTGTGGTGATYIAPTTNLLTATASISEDISKLRVNGGDAGSGSVDQGTGNYGNYPLYLGRRGGTTLPFNGRDYGIVVVGKATTADEITATERWLSGKTGFYAPIITGVPTIGVS